MAEGEGDPHDGRLRLIHAAMTQFADRGFDGASVREIAKTAEVSIGLISHHFGSKEGLREAVDEYVMTQFEEAMTVFPAADDEQPSPAVSQWVDDWIARHEAEAPALFGYFRRALLDESDWGAKLFKRFYDIAQTMITRLDAQGLIRPDVDRLWLPFLVLYLELGTTLLDPYVRRLLGRSGFDPTLWRRRHRAYSQLLQRGYGLAPGETPPITLE